LRMIPARLQLVIFSAVFSLSLLATDDANAAARKRLLHERLMDHFIFGIDAPTEWLNETRDKNGAKWDARVQYVSGGAAKSSWDTVFLDPWNKWVNPDKRRGVWAENFIKDTTANGYIAWLTFYNLAQSAPALYKPGPAQSTPVNAKVKETMKAYFEQVKLLMQLCDKYKPAPVVIQFEPDEWGHLLLGGARPGKQLDPEWVDIKVGSCGMEEIKDLPDNLIGYAQAIKRLRDKYAPVNVLIACNPSGWDYKGSMTGKKFGEYLNKCGCGEWDLAVFETGDRDKGMHGKPPPYNDESGICGTFENHLNWIKEFHETTKLPVVVWQVAMGNTHFTTCNNTPGHYCDNLAQTIFENYPQNNMISRYVAAGCIGWMFNAGQGDSTKCWDGLKDGITNPAPIAGNAGHKSEYPDDDGGYMRLRGAAYYKNPFPIRGKAKTPAATAASPLPLREGAGGGVAPAPKAPPAPTVDAKVLESWEAKLKVRVAAACKASSVSAFLRPMGPKGPEEKCQVNALEGESLTITLQGNKLPLAWKNLALRDKVNLAKAAIAKSDAETFLIAAVFLIADGRAEEAESMFSEAAALNPALEKEARAAIGMK